MKARLKRALQPLPLLVAAAIGAGLLFLLTRRPKAAIAGALLGLAVQLGVRLFGVS